MNQALEFPCEDLSIISVYNPSYTSGNVEHETASKMNSAGRIADLSSKYGLLSNLTNKDMVFNDTQILLFGDYSIIGRSILLQNHVKHQRFACGTIERGYSLKEAREVSAIASFHHPLGYAYGYIRLSQLIGHDGGQSDTTIEINLRHPGQYNRNSTEDHMWQIFVNAVSVDAIVKQPATR